MPRVRIFSWNPRRSSLPPRLVRRLPVGSRINNFGDLLGPLVVGRILAQHGIDPNAARRNCTLFSVGSVLHFAQDDDVIWGTGANGKMPVDMYAFRSLDVRAVRGPLTRDFLRGRGIECPSTFGDPALLLARLAPELFGAVARDQHRITVVPNFNDFAAFAAFAAGPDVLDPRAPLDSCLRRIAGSRFVVGSSLHGIVIAESLGIPARVISSGAEHPFKYEDYYLGTGRIGVEAAGSVEEAIAMGGRNLPEFDADRLLAAFPVDLWTGRRMAPWAPPRSGRGPEGPNGSPELRGYAAS
jgi:pyruvyltransferase